MPRPDRARELCRWAYNFRLQPIFHVLQSRALHGAGEQYSRIRHYIGRLGLWHRTSGSLVRDSARFAHVIMGATVEAIEIDSGGDVPRPRLDHSLETLADRVFPNYRNTSLREALLHKLGEAEEIRKWFYENSPKCHPHAEAVLIDWFYARRATFVHNDRYVGCSKRSCFCCSLYIRLHPAKMQKRPSHGNVWVKWQFPRPIYLTNQDDEKTTEAMSLIIRMTSETRLISHGTITNTVNHPRQRFESTTGLSTSLF